MRVQIAARRCDVSDSVRRRTQEQMERLTKYDPRLSSAEIVFEEEKHRKKVEGILSMDGAEPLIAQGQGDEFRIAVDRMADRLARMLRRRRSQHTDHQGPRLGEVEQAPAE